MKIEIKEKNGVTIITPITKRIDVASYEEFKHIVLKIIDDGKTLIVLNLSQVDFIDSRGLGTLVSFYKAISDKGWLGICEASVNVLDLFTLTRMDRVFDIYPSEEDALKTATVKKDIFDN